MYHIGVLSSRKIEQIDERKSLNKEEGIGTFPEIMNGQMNRSEEIVENKGYSSNIQNVSFPKLNGRVGNWE